MTPTTTPPTAAVATATQLRNARKRRARKKSQTTSTTTDATTAVVKMVVPGSCTPSNRDDGSIAISKQQQRRNDYNATGITNAVTTSSTSVGRNNNNKRKRNSATNVIHMIDPSQRYSSNPLQAPIVQRAQQFFHEVFHNSHCLDSTTNNNNNNNNRCTALKNDIPTKTTSTTTKPTTTHIIDESTHFPIHVGSIYGWRTVVKLPVRYYNNNNNNNKKKTKDITPQQQQLITIGLFAPGSHDIIPIVVDDNNNNNNTTTCICQTHHPMINQAIIHIQQVARSLQQHDTTVGRTLSSSSTASSHNNNNNNNTVRNQQLTAFSEDTGQGYLRHIALSVQRHTNRIQLVLVWNSLPPPSRQNDIHRNDQIASPGEDIDYEISQKVLSQLVQSLLLVKLQVKSADNSNNDDDVTPWKWHSIWVHYNNTWKHANAIFTHDGVWESLYHYNKETMQISNVDNTSTSEWNHSCPLGGVTEYLSTPSMGYNDNECDETSNSDVIDQLPHVPLHFPPHVFRQGNITAFTNIVHSIRTFIIHQFDIKSTSMNHRTNGGIDYRPSCLELYGGVGTIGLHIVDLCSKFVCSDENPYNVQCFNATTEAILQSLRCKSGYNSATVSRADTKVDIWPLPLIRYESASASVMVLDRLEHMNDIDIIIVDPPRKGMDIDVCRALLQTTIMKNSKTTGGSRRNDRNMTHEQHQVLIYVSCGFDAFVRDYQILTASSSSSSSSSSSISRPSRTVMRQRTANTNPWNLIHAEGHVLFPGSDAIETLAIFTRTKYPKKSE